MTATRQNSQNQVISWRSSDFILGFFPSVSKFRRIQRIGAINTFEIGSTRNSSLVLLIFLGIKTSFSGANDLLNTAPLHSYLISNELSDRSNLTVKWYVGRDHLTITTVIELFVTGAAQCCGPVRAGPGPGSARKRREPVSRLLPPAPPTLRWLLTKFKQCARSQVGWPKVVRRQVGRLHRHADWQPPSPLKWLISLSVSRDSVLRYRTCEPEIQFRNPLLNDWTLKSSSRLVRLYR